MTSETIDCPLVGFNVIKKMLENPRDKKLLVGLLQNSLDTDASNTTAMIDLLLGAEPEAEVPVQKIKTVIYPGQSTGISCKSQAGIVER